MGGQAKGDAAALPVEAGERGARFHRRGNQALVFEVQRDDVSGFGESSVAGGRIAVLHAGGDVAGGCWPDQRRPVGDGLGQRGNDRKFIVFYDDRFERVLDLLRRFRDQRDDLLADETDDIDRKSRSQRRGARRAVGSMEHRLKWQRFDAREIAARSAPV